MTHRERQILQLIEADPMISQQDLADHLGITRSSVAVHISHLMKKGCIAGKGYVLRSRSYTVVVGGANVDIGGHSCATLVPHDSNPGIVTTSPGGVGRNIAHNLCLMGIDVRLMTAFGDDISGEMLTASCTALGIDMSHALRIPGGMTSTYLYITDEYGEMTLAVSDMNICQQITPAYIQGNLPLLENAQVVVADTNIPPETLEYLAENCTKPLFVDPVSTAKAEKLRPILHRIHTLKPNRMEAELLSGVPIHDRADVEKAAEKLLEAGLERVFISLGADGVYAADEEGSVWLENLPGNVINTTGCGDAFMAALVWAYLENLDLRATALAGLAAASVARESEETINPGMSAELLHDRMKR